MTCILVYETGTWRIEDIDVNHDGKPDFITHNVENNDISILLAQ